MKATTIDRQELRRQVDWFIDGRDPIRAQRLVEVLALLESADRLGEMAVILLDGVTARTALEAKARELLPDRPHDDAGGL